MRVGPKVAADESPLGFTSRLKGAARFAAFCRKYLRVPKGHGVGKPLVLRPWQVELMAAILDPPVRPRTAGIMMPRGSGKTSLMAAWVVYALFTDPEGAAIVVAAVDQRQAEICFRAASRMIEKSPELAARAQLFRERIEVPGRGTSFVALPAEAKRLEGLDYTLAICDEIGFVGRDTMDALLLAQGKAPTSTLVGIGTPSAASESVLLDMRTYGQDHPEDTTFVWREFSAAGFEDHPVDCRHCWELACPALGDFAAEDAMLALLPPKTTEGAFRRARLCQFVSENTAPFIPPDVWAGLSTGEEIPDGTPVVLALDGSFSNDTTALLLGTVSTTPHFHPLRVWARPDPKDTTWRVPVLEVENAIRAACREWDVREIVADPFRWNRSLQVLQADGLPINEFPHSPSRLTKATTDLYSAAVNGNMSHSGAEVLTRHVAAATVVESDGGLRVGKASRKRGADKIDLVACLVMAHSRATWLAAHPVKRYRTVSFKS